MDSNILINTSSNNPVKGILEQTEVTKEEKQILENQLNTQTEL